MVMFENSTLPLKSGEAAFTLGMQRDLNIPVCKIYPVRQGNQHGDRQAAGYLCRQIAFNIAVGPQG